MPGAATLLWCALRARAPRFCLREVAKELPYDKRVNVVDTSNEIAGDGERNYRRSAARDGCRLTCARRATTAAR
jgi:stage III sporulation protein SpoIIIAA